MPTKTIKYPKPEAVPPPAITWMAQEALRWVLSKPSYDGWQEVPFPSPHYGACCFCGQATATAITTATAAEADNYAVRHCNCGDARRYQEELRKEQHRENLLRELQTEIAALFGGGAALKSKDVMGERTIEILNILAELELDRKIGKLAVMLTPTTKAQFSRNNDGDVVLERKDADTEKAVVKTNKR